MTKQADLPSKREQRNTMLKRRIEAQSARIKQLEDERFEALWTLGWVRDFLQRGNIDHKSRVECALEQVNHYRGDLNALPR